MRVTSPARRLGSAERGPSVFDKLTDSAGYTGASKQRFDRKGRGRGLAGRDSTDKSTQEEIQLVGRPSDGWPSVVILYADDYNISGESPATIPLHQWFSDRLGAAPQANYHFEQMVGLQTTELPPCPQTGARRRLLHQDEYIQFVLADYERRFNNGKRLPSVATPAVAAAAFTAVAVRVAGVGGRE